MPASVAATRAHRSIRWIPLLIALLSLACRDTAPVGQGRVRRIEVQIPSANLLLGTSVTAQAIARDGAGEIVEGTTITWRSLTPTVAEVSPAGLITGLSPGAATIRAAVGAVFADLQLTVVNPPIASLTFSAESALISLPGSATPVEVIARDATGRVIVAPTLLWQSSAPQIATVSATGVVTPIAVGRTTITAASEGKRAAINVRVDAVVTAASPRITSVLPSLAVPGGTLTLIGTGFAPTRVGNSVLVDGIATTVTAASSEQLSVQLPPLGSFPCAATRTVAVQVTVNGAIGVAPVGLRIAEQRMLAPGEALVLTSASASRCNELIPGGGRYLLTIQNAARTVASTGIGVSLRGEGASLAASTAAVATGSNGSAAHLGSPSPLALLTSDLGAERRAVAMHHRVLQENLSALRAAPSALLQRPGPRTALQVTQVGAVSPIRVPNLDNQNFCATFTAIGARTVFVGPHVAILEDTTPTANGRPTLRGQMDPLIAEIGQEFEQKVWPSVAGQFGNPLAMDGRLDNNGRVVLVLTPRMNTMLGGSVLGAVVNCDFFPTSVNAASNLGEYIYLQVPTDPATGIGTGTRDFWRWRIRSTIAHELKHVAAFAERISRNLPLEELWLEESTARQAEELFARAVFGTRRGANHGYDATLFCESRPANPAAPQCAGVPRVMRQHFDGLWQFLDRSATLSPLGRIGTGDISFYGSGWALTRWIADAHAPNESEFFTSLVTNAQTGVSNLEARAGRGWDELLGEWSLAMAADDRPGFVPLSTRLRFPSWDLPDAFLGLCRDFGPCNDPFNAQQFYPRAHPLQLLRQPGASLDLDIAFISTGGFVAVEITGAGGPAARQLLDLRGFGGGVLPVNARLAILRIE